MSTYTVKQLSTLAGVSVRTLHHYDQIGLLKPERRSESGYRYYGRQELLRLQQILFFKEMDLPLGQIREILDDPIFDLLESLQGHRKQIRQRITRLHTLLSTIDKTILELKNKKEMITDKELYEGFSEEQAKTYRQEAIHRWGQEKVDEVENRLKKLSRGEWKDIKQEGEEVTKLLAELMDHQPANTLVQKAIGQYHRHLNNFYEVSEERYRALSDMYVQDDRFRAHYEKYRIGLAEFIRQAIHIYCDNGMKVLER